MWIQSNTDPSGLSQDPSLYQVKSYNDTTDVDTSVTYLCEALPWATLADFKWRIKKIDTALTTAGGNEIWDTQTVWARDNINFDKTAADLNTVSAYFEWAPTITFQASNALDDVIPSPWGQINHNITFIGSTGLNSFKILLSENGIDYNTEVPVQTLIYNDTNPDSVTYVADVPSEPTSFFLKGVFDLYDRLPDRNVILETAPMFIDAGGPPPPPPPP